MKYLILLITLLILHSTCTALPSGFVYLSDIDNSILQDIRYAGMHNFIGRPILGYNKPVCILTYKAANALKQIQTVLHKQGYSLKVYDCYRPKSASEEMYAWSTNIDDQLMRTEFYPREKKSELFDKGYIALYSGHNRGSTVDLTLVKLANKQQQAPYQSEQSLVTCFATDRIKDDSIDMGTGFDCLDETANFDNQAVSTTAHKNRLKLRTIMQRYGFTPYANEWWHFSLKREPYKRQRFNFPVE